MVNQEQLMNVRQRSQTFAVVWLRYTLFSLTLTSCSPDSESE